MRITAILVAYNSGQVIADALQPLCGHPLVASVIVVDNASTDSTATLVRERFPNVVLLQNQANEGFGRACNRALEQVVSDYALLINPDATIDRNGISQLLACADMHPNAAIVAPMFSSHGSEPQRTDFVSGALAIWRMEHMKKVGFFDPAFFLFYEDNDISLRTAAAGYEMLLVPGIRASHTPGRSSGTSEAQESLKLRSSVWSSLYFCRKHHGYLSAMKTALMQAAILLSHRQSYAQRMERGDRLRAIFYFLRNPVRFELT